MTQSRWQSTQGVSPVVGVILMVAVTVILSAAIGMFVFNMSGLTESGTPPESVQIENTGDGVYRVTLLSDPAGDAVLLQVNGTQRNASLTRAGQSAEVRLAQGDSFSVVSTHDGKQRLLTSRTQSDSGAGTTSAVVYDVSIEPFEDTGLDEYSGAVEYDTVQSTTVQSGDSALHINPNSSDAHPDILSYPGDGLPYYPVAGDTFEYYTRIETRDAESVFYWGVQSKFDAYGLKLSGTPAGDVIELLGPSGVLNSTSWDPTQYENEWLHVRIDWRENGSMTATVTASDGTRIANISATNATYSRGGIHFKGNGGTNYDSIWFDSVRAINATG